MKIIQLTPGTGNFHCGSCLRDHTLVKGLRALGHDATIIPLYLPMVLDEPDPDEANPIFYGGINTYLQQKSALFRKTPRWVDKLLDARRLLSWTSRFSDMTSPEDLGALTLSTLQGESGQQGKELERLVGWLKGTARPDILVLSNVLLVGMARRLKEALGDIPIACTLQGEDSFLDSLPEPFREQAWTTLRERVRDVDGVIGVSRYYAELMARRLELDEDRLHVVANGISFEGFTAPAAPPKVPTLGYLARMCPPKGLHTLIDAFITLKERGAIPELRLLVAGAQTPGDKKYVAELCDRLKAAGCFEDVDFRANLSREDKIKALQEMSVLSVPAMYGESFGLYILEALACGVPFVQPEHAAFPELLESLGGGMLYDPDADDHHVEVLEALLKDEERRLSLGAAGREAAIAGFGEDSMARAAAEVYQSIAAAAAPRGG